MQILRDFNSYANLSCPGAIAVLYCDLHFARQPRGQLSCGRKCWCFLSALALAGSAAFAQQRFDGRAGEPSFQFRGPNPEDLGAFTDARVAALKAGLRLTPEQEKSWPAFEQAYRNLAKLRTDRVAAGRGQAPATDDQNMIHQMQRRADTVSQYGAALQDWRGRPGCFYPEFR